MEEDFLAKLYQLRKNWLGPWIIVRDFNLIRYPTDTTGNKAQLPYSSEFDSLIDSLMLTEINLNNLKFIWSNHRDILTLSKLNRCIVSIEWMAHSFPKCHPHTSAKTTSDRTPIELVFKQNLWRNKRFFYEDFWYTVSGFDDMVKQCGVHEY